jgi:hypothetical protein
VNEHAHDPAANLHGVLGILPGAAAINYHTFIFHETRGSR